MTQEFFPDPFTKVYFLAATGIVRSWRASEKNISDATSRHGASNAVLMENGYIIIDQAWGRRPQEKIEKLNDNTIKKLKKRFKK